MSEAIELLIHFVVSAIKLLKPGGVKVVMAETIAMKQQLIVLNRGKRRPPKLTTSDRFLFGILAIFIGGSRLKKIAVIIKPTTLLAFHKSLVNGKYSRLYSNKTKRISGRKPQEKSLIYLVIEMKKRNPSFGYGRISMQIFKAFGTTISRFTVGRILRKNKDKLPSGDGPSWLTFSGHMKDSLWSADLFRCESIMLKSHWVMVVWDQYTRMFNEVISGKSLPKYLSSDTDPLFLFRRWQCNLRVLDVEELKSVPGTPTSHLFIERVIGSTRREYLDHLLFFNSRDLQNRLDEFQTYYNDFRAHSSLEMKTPTAMAFGVEPDEKVVSIDRYRWKKHCSGLYQLPVAA